MTIPEEFERAGKIQNERRAVNNVDNLVCDSVQPIPFLDHIGKSAQHGRPVVALTTILRLARDVGIDFHGSVHSRGTVCARIEREGGLIV